MLDALLFLLPIACLGLVLGYYLLNELRGAKGERGLLGIRKEPELPAPQPSYRKRGEKGGGAASLVTRLRRRYREKDSNGKPAGRPN